MPWYEDGLHFRCTRCGKCCTGEPGFVWVDEQEIRAIAEFRGEDPVQVKGLYTRQVDDEFSLREKANGDCVFYDRREGCTIYPVRPRQCRSWPFWESHLKSPQAWKETCQVCPGAGMGDLIPVEEIARRIALIRL